MVNQVRPRPNHYELLGLTPAAKVADVHRAFVAKMSSFGSHSIDEAAQFLVAYETLRDAAKRRDYDASLGHSAKAEPREWSIAVTPPRWTPFMAKVPTNESRRITGRAQPVPEPHVTPDHPRAARAEPEVISPRIQSRTEKGTTAPQISASPEARPKDASKPDQDLEAVLRHIREVGRAEKERLRHAESGPSDWRRVGLALGGLVVGAGILGTVAGLSVQDKTGAADAQPSPRAAQPGAKLDPGLVPSPPAPIIESAGAQQPDEVTKDPARNMTTKPRALRQRHSLPKQAAESSAVKSPPAQDLAVENAPLPGDAEPAKAIAADLPVSTSVIAHTIEKIGYACGAVSSAAPVEGKAHGVYKIICSSGQSYQATPVQGRYHFRRLGNQ